MHIGETAKITCPSELAYGEQGSGPIPPNSTLVFDIEVLNCETTYWLSIILLFKNWKHKFFWFYSFIIFYK